MKWFYVVALALLLTSCGSQSYNLDLTAGSSGDCTAQCANIMTERWCDSATSRFLDNRQAIYGDKNPPRIICECTLLQCLKEAQK